jgi:hypothetical protein
MFKQVTGLYYYKNNLISVYCLKFVNQMQNNE